MMNRRNLLVGLGAGLALCPDLGRASNASLNIIATTGMVTDLVLNIAGPIAEVRGIMGSGIDPHSYRHTRSDIVSMTKADIVFYHGLGLEVQMLELFEQLLKKVTVHSVADQLDSSRLLKHADYENAYDPHIWMNPLIWAGTIDPVLDVLNHARPEQRDVFIKNANRYRTQLMELDAYSNDVLSSVPKESAILITAHDAFAYFGAAYGFEVIGIQGISTNSEAGLFRIGELVEILVKREIAAVFVESSVSDRNLLALMEGAGAQGHEVSLGGELFSDAMGPEGSYEGTYLGMIDHNVTTIAKALGGIAPDRGWQNKLKLGT